MKIETKTVITFEVEQLEKIIFKEFGVKYHIDESIEGSSNHWRDFFLNVNGEVSEAENMEVLDGLKSRFSDISLLILLNILSRDNVLPTGLYIIKYTE